MLKMATKTFALLLLSCCFGPVLMQAVDITNADRVANDRRSRPDLAPTAVAYYVVPSLSSVKRLPNVFPGDGQFAGQLQIVAAKGEFAPASFVVYPNTDVAKAELKATALTGKAGTIPAGNIDLKIVKCWYQAGTAWYSYFADITGREMVPELLLNDEDLIRVDTRTRDDYLRVGDQFIWISNPLSVNVPFNAETTPVADAKTLQPFRLEAGAFKQFWVTVKIPKDAAPGIYTGNLELSGAGVTAGTIPFVVRVLPFELPAPATYYDLNREFYTVVYNEPGYPDILKKNGGDRAQADRKMLAIYENMRDHNIRHPIIRDYRPDNKDAFIRQLELYRQAGLATDPIFGAIPAIPSYGWMGSVSNVPLHEQSRDVTLLPRVDAADEIVTRLFGHPTVYCFGWDEPSQRLVVAERNPWKYVHDKGLKIYSTGTDNHLKFAAYNEDFVNIPGDISRDRAAKWHAVGARITNYASPHTGPENPDFMRRIHGLQLYKANYDGLGNYIVSCNEWNDFLGEEYNYRQFNMTYPTRDGVIDTLAWEGMREAVDDVRYATLLKTLAAKAIATGKTEAQYAGRQALKWLELLDENSADLNTARLEMINYILKLSEVQ